MSYEMSCEMSFENSPPPISVQDIKETVHTDVVVIGAGIAGLTAALSSAEAGAKTILLEKGPTFHHRGLHNAAIASKLQKKAGIKVDKEKLISSIMEWGDYRGDQRIVRKLIERYLTSSDEIEAAAAKAADEMTQEDLRMMDREMRQL